MKKGICVFLSVMLFVTMLLSGTVLVSAASTECIKTDKTEYKSGEMVKISYDFDIAENTRCICIYKDTLDSPIMYVVSATSLSGDNIWAPTVVSWTWQGGGPAITTQPLTPGTYIMKPMYIKSGGVSTQSTDFVEGAKSSITATFTVVENTGSANPTISATKTELEYGEDLEIAFDGVTNKLGTNTLRIELKNSAGMVEETWVLWNGGTEYAGISGSVSYFAADTYTATLICSDPDFVLGNTEIQFTVKEAPLQPTEKPTATPMATPTETPIETSTQEPSANATEVPTQEPTVGTSEITEPTSSEGTQNSTPNKDGEFPWVVVGIVAVVVVAGGALFFVVIRKK